MGEKMGFGNAISPLKFPALKRCGASPCSNIAKSVKKKVVRFCSFPKCVGHSRSAEFIRTPMSFKGCLPL